MLFPTMDCNKVCTIGVPPCKVCKKGKPSPQFKEETRIRKQQAKYKHWKAKNPDKYHQWLQNLEEWKANNPEKVQLAKKQSDAKRRARKHNTKHGRVSYAKILEQYGYICHICGESIEQGDLHFDHVVPLVHYGSHTQDNIKPSHSWCNMRKGSKL